MRWMGFKTLLKGQPSVTVEPEMLPVVSSRMIAMDGTPAAEVKLKNFPKRMLQVDFVDWFGSPPAGTTVVQGKWWAAEQSRAAKSGGGE